MNKIKYDIEKRTFLLKKMFELKSVTKVQRSWRTKYKSSNAPTTSMINTLVKKFNDTGLVENSSRVRLESTHKRDEAKTT